MPNQTSAGIRLGALTSSVVLVGGFIAYRTGLLSSPIAAGSARPASVETNSSDDGDLQTSPDSTRLSTESVTASSSEPGSTAPVKSADQAQALSAEEKLAELQNAYVIESSRTFMAGSKSVVLIDAKIAKQRAIAEITFAELDRNRDGKLTQQESDIDTWKKCLKYQLVEDNVVSLAGFQKMFVIDSAKNK